jgi:hypothetical protein
MSSQPFLRPRLVGERFENRAIPLEVLKDLAVLEELIVEVAKSEFFKDHPDRKYSPRGFTDGIQLKLTGLEEGSTIPIISLDVAASSLFPLANQRYFEQAREAVVSAIGAAEQNRPVVEHLPEKTLSYFNRLGRTLRNGEAIEFTTAAHPIPARLTKDTRRRLLLASSTIKELTEETSLRGTVPEADQDGMTFQVQIADGRKVRAPITEQHYETILDAFNGYKSGIKILLQGIGRFNRNEKLLGFDSIEHVSLLDARDVPARLDELRFLKPGWLDGQGEAPSHEGLDWLSQAFDRHYPDDLPLPFVYPTLEGGLQAEWSIGPNEASLEIDLTTRRGGWHSLDAGTDGDESRDLDLAQPKDWQWVAERIAKLSAGAR